MLASSVYTAVCVVLPGHGLLMPPEVVINGVLEGNKKEEKTESMAPSFTIPEC